METPPRSSHQAPTFAQLVKDEQQGEFSELPGSATDQDKDKHDRLLQLLNMAPHASWIKTHETLNVKVKGVSQKLQYIPIDKIKFILTRLFGLYWRDEIVSVTTAFNSQVVHVRLHYCIPGTNIWLSRDGIGAVGVQTNAGAAAGSLSEIKADGVMKAAPSAASYALSNAAEKLGKVFGAALNKGDYLDFAGTVYGQVANGASPEPVAPEQPATYFPPQAAPQKQYAYQAPPTQQQQYAAYPATPQQAYTPPPPQNQFTNPQNLDL